ncbi:MAG: M20/M25/M40 family metallo-hydrolase [Verrucomicrobiota bacterium]
MLVENEQTARLRERLIQLTRDLVLIESTDDRPGERKRCFQLIRNHLDEVPGLRIESFEKNGYESLVVLPKGVKEPAVLFCAHLDVIHHPDPDSYRSEVRDGKIFGPGAGDMKGQLAIIIELFRSLGRGGMFPNELSAGLAITSDEERGGENGVRFLIEEVGLRCGMAVIPDGGSLDEIIVAEKGILHLQLNSHGTSAHAARPWLGDNALEQLLADIAAIRALFPDAVLSDDGETERWVSTCTPTMLSTPNDSPNRIPEIASATLDIRLIPPLTTEETLADIREVVSPSTDVQPLIAAESTELKPDKDFIRLAEEVIGKPPRLTKTSGGSDGRYFSAEGIPVIISRPDVGNLHGHDEWIGIDSMLAYFEICRRYAVLRGSSESESGNP